MPKRRQSSDPRTYRFRRQWRGPQRQALLRSQGGCCLLCPAVDQPGARLHQAHAAGAWPVGPDTVTVLLCARCHKQYDTQSSQVTPPGDNRLPPGLTPSLRLTQTRSSSSELAGHRSESSSVGAGSAMFAPGSPTIFGIPEGAPDA